MVDLGALISVTARDVRPERRPATATREGIADFAGAWVVPVDDVVVACGVAYRGAAAGDELCCHEQRNCQGND